MRIFPEMCAMILWPLSSATRNIALGSDSCTTPLTSIASPFGISVPGLARQRKDLGAVRGDGRVAVVSLVDRAVVEADDVAGLEDPLRGGHAVHDLLVDRDAQRGRVH